MCLLQSVAADVINEIIRVHVCMLVKGVSNLFVHCYFDVFLHCRLVIVFSVLWLAVMKVIFHFGNYHPFE